MGGMIIVLIIMVIGIGGGSFLLGRKMASKIATTDNSFLRGNTTLIKVFLLSYVVFAGCFVFPIRSEPFPLDFTKLYLLIASYGAIGLGFAGVYEAEKGKTVYSRVLFLTVLGMICRYILEYGETSNTYNFTIRNIISYLAIIPAFTAIGYHYIAKNIIVKK